MKAIFMIYLLHYVKQEIMSKKVSKNQKVFDKIKQFVYYMFTKGRKLIVCLKFSPSFCF